MSIKGSLAAKEAARKAHITRAANKQAKLQKKEEFKEKYLKEPKKVAVEQLSLNKLEDTEAYVFYTDGPTKISYSSKYKTLKVSPHHIVLRS